MPKSENYSTTTVTDSRGKKSVKVSHTISESSMKRSYHERYQMVDLLSLPTFIILFVLVVFASTILYFKNNIDTYMPDGETYVQYTDQDIIDMQLDTPITELNGNTLKQVFEESLIFNSLQLVTNGDFSNGTTGWVGAGGTLSTNQGITSVTGDGSSGNIRIYQDTNVPLIANNKYYVASRSRVTNSVSTAMQLQIRQGDYLGAFISVSTQNTPVENQYYFMSFIGTNNTVTTDIFVAIISTYADGLTANNKVLQSDYLYAFNISTLITNKQYSPLFNTTFDLMSDVDIKTQMDYWVTFPYKMLDFNELGWFPTQAEQNNWEEVWYYIKTIGPQPETIFALGTIDPNTGRDFYHLDVSDYERLGNNIQSSFKGLSTMIKGMTNTIESIGDFLAKVGGTIENFYDEAYEFMSGETVDEVWTKAQNIWLWITGKGWAVKQP